MSGASKKLMGTTAAGGDLLAIEDVFSTYLWVGDDTNNRTITNGIDLATHGGMVLLKNRTNVGDWGVFDTERGVVNSLQTNTTSAQLNNNGLSSVTTSGFITDNAFNYDQNRFNVASWTFRKAPRFFDVVTWTGDGTTGRTIAHNLGVAPGFIAAKTTSSADFWRCYHRSLGATKAVFLNLTNAESVSTNHWNDTEPTDSVFTLGDNVNFSGRTYVAYLFAHDPLGPSGDGSDGLIACGSYTGNGGENPINLGWEPQWLLVKCASSDGGGDPANWWIIDNMRGWTADNTVNYLEANTSGAELQRDRIRLTPTGFTPNVGFTPWNASGQTYIYIAIRRGPMRQPTSGTEVFAPISATATTNPQFWNAGFAVDSFLGKFKNSTSDWLFFDRLRGGSTNLFKALITNKTDVETNLSGFGIGFDRNDGVNDASTFTNQSFTPALYSFRRAPGFFDVVAYTGTGSARTVPHNLGVAPELMIVRNRSARANWAVFHAMTASGYKLQFLNNTDAQLSYTYPSALVSQPTDTSFEVGGIGTVGDSANNYIAYLFATLPGVSKVGSYTGNGTSQTIDCGFTSGARFVLIKRTDSTGDWAVFDTARGIVSGFGTEPYLALNSTAAEVSTNDAIDPHPSGFIVSETGAPNPNTSGANYIFLAIA